MHDSEASGRKFTKFILKSKHNSSVEAFQSLKLMTSEWIENEFEDSTIPHSKDED